MDSNNDCGSDLDWSLPSHLETIEPSLDDVAEPSSSTTYLSSCGIDPLKGPRSLGIEAEEEETGENNSDADPIRYRKPDPDDSPPKPLHGPNSIPERDLENSSAVVENWSALVPIGTRSLSRSTERNVPDLSILEKTGPLQGKTVEVLINEADWFLTNFHQLGDAVEQAAVQCHRDRNYTEAIRLYNKHIDITRKVSPTSLKKISFSLWRIFACHWLNGDGDQVALARYRLKYIAGMFLQRGGGPGRYWYFFEDWGVVVGAKRRDGEIAWRLMLNSKPEREIELYWDVGDELKMIMSVIPY